MNNHNSLVTMIQSIALLIGVALGNLLSGITPENAACTSATIYSLMSAHVL